MQPCQLITSRLLLDNCHSYICSGGSNKAYHQGKSVKNNLKAFLSMQVSKLFAKINDMVEGGSQLVFVLIDEVRA